MTAVIRVPSLQLVAEFADSATAMKKAQAIREAHPTLTVVVEFDVEPPLQLDPLALPEFLDRRTWGTA